MEPLDPSIASDVSHLASPNVPQVCGHMPHAEFETPQDNVLEQNSISKFMPEPEPEHLNANATDVWINEPSPTISPIACAREGLMDRDEAQYPSESDIEMALPQGCPPWFLIRASGETCTWDDVFQNLAIIYAEQVG